MATALNDNTVVYETRLVSKAAASSSSQTVPPVGPKSDEEIVGPSVCDNATFDLM